MGTGPERSTRWRGRRARACSGAIALATALACASGPALRDGVFRDRAAGFRIAAPPAGWTRIEVEGADLAFRGPSDASLALSSRCDVGSEPIETLANQLRAGLGPHELVDVRALELAGRPARRQIVTLAGARVALVTRAAAPCVQDFVLVAPRDFDAALSVFDAWWASFAPESAP